MRTEASFLSAVAVMTFALLLVGCGSDGDEPDVTCLLSGTGTQFCGDGNRLDSPSSDGNDGASSNTATNPRNTNNSTEIVEPEPEEEE